MFLPYLYIYTFIQDCNRNFPKSSRGGRPRPGAWVARRQSFSASQIFDRLKRDSAMRFCQPSVASGKLGPVAKSDPVIFVSKLRA